MEGPNGCRVKSSKFQLVGLLEIIKLGPRALYWGPTQTSSLPTWRPTWHKYGTKTLDPTKESGTRFSLTQITMGPIDSIETPPLNEIYLGHGEAI
jgi:hypothetical protein